MIRQLIICVLLVTSSSVFADELNIASSWNSAKKMARDKIYFDHQTTFYCGCSYEEKGRSGGVVDHEHCDYDGSDDGWLNRTNTLEWEHVLPAKLMPASTMACWTTGLPNCKKAGRACCEKHEVDAKKMIFDLHNIVPSIGQVNAIRGDKPYGQISGEERELGQCDFEWNRYIVEPPTVKLGETARIWLYMSSQHGLELTKDELGMYQAWSCSDTPDDWEILRNTRIAAVQGNSNPFVVNPCSQ